MRYLSKNSLSLSQFSSVSAAWPLVHAISLRAGGVSEPPYSSLNVGLHVGDDQEKVLANRSAICAAINASPARFVAARQIHSGNVAVVSSNDQLGGFYSWEEAQPNVDALVTSLPNATLFVNSADCALSLIFDSRNVALAVVHSGWRGAALNIYRNVVELMTTEYGSRPCDLFVGIAPLVSPQTYTVSRARANIFQRLYGLRATSTFLHDEDGTIHLDILALLRLQLDELGIEHVEEPGMYSDQHLDLFYSARREGVTGRFGLFAFISK